LNGLLQDLRAVVRGLAGAPSYALIILVTLALGTGASSAMFSVLRATLLRPPPFPDAERLVMISLTQRDQGRETFATNVPTRTFEFLREHAASFVSIAAFTTPNVSVTGYDQSERVPVEVVSADYFHVLGVNPSLGRRFRSEEDSIPGAHPVVVLSHALWQRRFAGDPAVIGKQLSVNRHQLTVVGVMPARFAGVSGRSELWIARAMAPTVAFPFRAYSVVARLRDDRTIAQARTELGVLMARMTAAFPDSQSTVVERGSELTALGEARVDANNRQPVLVLFAAVGALLLIACANAATLVLARAASREREVAVRLAVGASRWRLMRLLLSESLVLSVAGGIAGLLVAFWTIRTIVPLMPPRPSRAGPLGTVGDFAVPELDLTVISFTWGIVFLTATLVGLVPALRSARTDPVEALRSGGRALTPSRRRLFALDTYGALTVVEMALAVMLLVGSGLLVKSLWKLERMPLGFDVERVTSFQIAAPIAWYPPAEAPNAIERLVDAVGRVPGVERVAATYYTPFDPGARHEVRRATVPRTGDAPMVGHHYVTPAYFDVLGIPIARGRGFTTSDRLGSPYVALVSASAAERLWPGEDPIGKRFYFDRRPDAPADSAVEVVGLVGDVRYRPGEWRVEPDLYTPYYQFASLAYALFVVRSNTPLDVLAPALRQAVASVDPDLPVSDLSSLDERGGRALSRRRLNAMLLTAFAILALTIAMVGVYGVMAHLTAQRTREFGIRIALGAARGDVLRLVLSRATILVFSGLAIGTMGALAATRVLSSQLYDTAPTDLSTYGLIAVVLAATAFLASYLPARRATRVEPVVALRAE
jgi:putative ABC transport system permease protein